MYQRTPVDDPHYLCLHHQKIQDKWLNPWNVLIFKRNLKHNISLKLIEMKTYLSLLELTQLKKHLRILETIQTY